MSLALLVICASSFLQGGDCTDIKLEPLLDATADLSLGVDASQITTCTLSRSNAPAILPILTGSTGRRIYPVNKDNGDIIISAGSTFTASCSPTANLLSNFQTNKIDVLCTAAGTLLANGGKVIVSYADLGCAKPGLEEILTVTDPCYQSNDNITIRFTTSVGSFPLISMCHNQSVFNTLYARHQIQGQSLKAADISNNRPGFKKAQYFSSKVSPATAYGSSSQREMVLSLVGSASLADTYIDPAQSLYFARGHLAPDGDFIYVSEQNATYYYVNVVPQWQIINNGNWKALEGAVRNLAVSKNTDFDVYTGGYGVLKLKDVNSNRVEIFLARDADGRLTIPAPGLTWKVVHDKKNKAGIAVIMVNNPHDLSVTSEDLLCKSICDQLPWVTWDIYNIRKGYTYCCDVASFSAAVPYAPKLAGLSLLV